MVSLCIKALEFTELTVPKDFAERQSKKEGVWAKIVVLEGLSNT